MSKTTCPRCGNSDTSTIEDNGISSKSMDYTFFCVARVAPEDCAMAPHPHHEPEDFDADGKVKCGEQWCPNMHGDE